MVFSEVEQVYFWNARVLQCFDQLLLRELSNNIHKPRVPSITITSCPISQRATTISNLINHESTITHPATHIATATRQS
eukprot:m.166954 g.166954  ORF g.166954 m.166954 type:complete len:79 (+) comp31449_c0_seq1:265-501(+)